MKQKFKITVPLAILVTLITVIYQRSTGPTYPKKVMIGKLDAALSVKFPRSHGGETNAPIEVPKITKNMQGTISFKRYPTNDLWTTVELKEEGNFLKATLPNQPPAGKLIYFLSLDINGEVQKIGSEKDPIFIRYKGEVPTYVLAPHIFFMFLSMLLSVLALFEAAFKTASFAKISYLTTGSLFVGGMILGPIVQKFAFGVYWAGFPYDWDLTDNKLLISFIFWFGAAMINFKRPNRIASMIAAVVLICMYAIPHSTMGSQFDYEKGSVETKTDGFKDKL
jgi:hypothetical protein